MEEQFAVSSRKLEVYPNPANEYVVVSIKYAVNTIEVTNLLGQLQNCSITQYSIHNTENYQLNTSLQVFISSKQQVLTAI